MKWPFVSRRKYDSLFRDNQDKTKQINKLTKQVLDLQTANHRRDKQLEESHSEIRRLHQEVHARRLNTACTDKALSLVTEIAALEPTYYLTGKIKNLPRIRKAMWTKILDFRKECQG